jgi:YfiH family protein
VSPIAVPVDWPATRNVRAWFSIRRGGVSRGPFESLNLATHVGDDGRCVAENRARLAHAIALPAEPCWLTQVHGCTLRRAADIAPGSAPRGDGSVAEAPDLVCAVLTADCVPVLLTDRSGSKVAAVHAGWRGLASGILGHAVAAMGSTPREIIAWLGPAISAGAYEVGEDVRAALVARLDGAARAFRRNERGRWQADLYALARLGLAAAGVDAIFGGGFCTYTEKNRFFSHRREAPCGRMAALIWRTE